MSLLAHGLTLLALVYLLHRVALPAPTPEPSIAMVFAPTATLVDATPAPAGPPIAKPPPVEQAAPLPAEPEPKVEEAAPAIPQPVEQAAPLPAEPEPKVEQAAPATPLPVPVQRPAPRQMAAARPSVAARPATATLSAPAAVAIAPLLPAHPVAGMESDRPPAYPEMARRRGQQGRVVLQVNVSAEGMPVTVAVVETSGFTSLDAAAICAGHPGRHPGSGDCRSTGAISPDRLMIRHSALVARADTSKRGADRVAASGGGRRPLPYRIVQVPGASSTRNLTLGAQVGANARVRATF